MNKSLQHKIIYYILALTLFGITFLFKDTLGFDPLFWLGTVLFLIMALQQGSKDSESAEYKKKFPLHFLIIGTVLARIITMYFTQDQGFAEPIVLLFVDVIGILLLIFGTIKYFRE